MNKKALVLSSGGVDSTTCVSVAVEGFGRENVSTVSIFYGQKHRKELECAQKVAEYYGLPHYELDLSKLFQYSNCSLLAHSTEEIVHKSYEQQIAENGEGKVSTYVPFRNGLMLSAVASLAMSIYEKDDVSIFIGAHADDAAGNAYGGLQRGLHRRHGTGYCPGYLQPVPYRGTFCQLQQGRRGETGTGAPYSL